MIWSRVMKRAACAGLVMALLGGMVACATGPAETDAQREADKAVAARVQTALDADTLLYAKHITVRAREGVVRLSGYVWDPSDFSEAIQTASLVDGVSRVINNLELQRNGIDNSSVER
jgi:osmotically-inducible protein OsmY